MTRYKVEYEIEGTLYHDAANFNLRDYVLTFSGYQYYIPDDAKVTEIKPPSEPGYYRDLTSKDARRVTWFNVPPTTPAHWQRVKVVPED